MDFVILAKKVPPGTTKSEMVDFLSDNCPQAEVSDREIMIWDRKPDDDGSIAAKITLRNQEQVDALTGISSMHELGGQEIEFVRLPPRRPGGAGGRPAEGKHSVMIKHIPREIRKEDLMAFIEDETKVTVKTVFVMSRVQMDECEHVLAKVTVDSDEEVEKLVAMDKNITFPEDGNTCELAVWKQKPRLQDNAPSSFGGGGDGWGAKNNDGWGAKTNDAWGSSGANDDAWGTGSKKAPSGSFDENNGRKKPEQPIENLNSKYDESADKKCEIAVCIKQSNNTWRPLFGPLEVSGTAVRSLWSSAVVKSLDKSDPSLDEMCKLVGQRSADNARSSSVTAVSPDGTESGQGAKSPGKSSPLMDVKKSENPETIKKDLGVENVSIASDDSSDFSDVEVAAKEPVAETKVVEMKSVRGHESVPAGKINVKAEDGNLTVVTMVWDEYPDGIWVLNQSDEPGIKQLTADLRKAYDDNSSSQQQVTDIRKGDYVVAQDEKEYLRALVLDTNEKTTSLRGIDFGNPIDVPNNKIWRLTDEFAKIPAFAVPVTVFGGIINAKEELVKKMRERLNFDVIEPKGLAVQLIDGPDENGAYSVILYVDGVDLCERLLDSTAELAAHRSSLKFIVSQKKDLLEQKFVAVGSRVINDKTTEFYLYPGDKKHESMLGEINGTLPGLMKKNKTDIKSIGAWVDRVVAVKTEMYSAKMYARALVCNKFGDSEIEVFLLDWGVRKMIPFKHVYAIPEDVALKFPVATVPVRCSAKPDEFNDNSLKLSELGRLVFPDGYKIYRGKLAVAVDSSN